MTFPCAGYHGYVRTVSFRVPPCEALLHSSQPCSQRKTRRMALAGMAQTDAPRFADAVHLRIPAGHSYRSRHGSGQRPPVMAQRNSGVLGTAEWRGAEKGPTVFRKPKNGLKYGKLAAHINTLDEDTPRKPVLQTSASKNYSGKQERVSKANPCCRRRPFRISALQSTGRTCSPVVCRDADPVFHRRKYAESVRHTR